MAVPIHDFGALNENILEVSVLRCLSFHTVQLASILNPGFPSGFPPSTFLYMIGDVSHDTLHGKPGGLLKKWSRGDSGGMGALKTVLQLLF